MKKNLSVNTLALSSIKTRKKQYFLMIIGIVFAMIFSSSILFFASSMASSMKEMAKNSVGDCDEIILNCDENFINNAVNDNVFSNYGYAHIIGFVQTQDSEEEQGSAVAYLDDKAKALSYISFAEGSYPENEGEIALEQATLARLKISDAKIGDTITFNFYNQNASSLDTKAVTKSFKLVGIAKNKLTNIVNHYADPQTYFKTIPSAYVYQGANTDLGGKENLCCYVKYNKDFTYKGEKDSYLARDEYYTDMGLYESKIMSRLVVYSDYYEYFQSGTNRTIMLSIVLVLVLLTASAIGIINAFNSNLKDRKKQIGLLRTVGATRQQVINIYGREALFISIVCAPVSVAASYFLVKLAVVLLGEDFIFKPNVLVLLLCAVVSVIFVMLAACIPLISASRISPMQSIRNIELTRKMKNKKIKSKKSFNTPSLLAKRSLVFHRGKRIIVSILLIGTIVMSCYGFSYLNYNFNDYYNEPYDYDIRDNSAEYMTFANIKNKGGFNENQKRDILLSPYVDKVTGFKNCNAVVKRDAFSEYDKIVCNYYCWGVYADKYWNEDGMPPVVTKDNYDEVFRSGFTDEYLELKQKCSIDKDFYQIDIQAADSTLLELLKNSVISGEINIDKINSGQEIILVAPQKIGLEFENEKDGYRQDLDKDEDFDSKKDYIKTAECEYKVGDVLDLSVIMADELEDEESVYGYDYTDKYDAQVKIGAVISELPHDAARTMGYYQEFMLLTSINGFEHFYSDSRYGHLNVYLKTECTDEIDDEMLSLIDSVTATTSVNPYIYSQYGMQKEDEQTRQTLLISMIAIIILFLSISASIINNSFSSQIREGKREIGTLRAVGASQREIIMSYIRQLISIFGLSYGVGFAGFGISYGVIYFISYMNAKELQLEFKGLELNVTLWQTILACLILFAICSINLMFKIRKEMKDSIIDNIREL